MSVSILVIDDLIPAIVFSMVGPGLSILESRKSIARLDRDTAFSNLKNNEKVSWVVRLVAYDPIRQPALSLNKLTRLGVERQKFTFVADYKEWRGYTVDDAMSPISRFAV
jgi:hypothetical protein